MSNRRKKRAQLRLLRITFVLSLLALICSVVALFLLNSRVRNPERYKKSASAGVTVTTAGNPNTETVLKETIAPEPALPSFSQASAPDETQTQTQEAPVETPDQASSALPEALRNSRDEAGLTEERIAQIIEENRGRFYFDRINEEEQRLYAELYHIMTTLSQDVYLSTKDANAMEKVQNCVMCDHPEIFYITGYYSTRYTIGGETAGYSFTGRSQYDADEIARRNVQIEQYITTCLSGVDASWDDYTKIRYIYEYIISHTSYLPGAPDNQNICSVMITNESVCQGYAKAAQLLCGRLGIPATLVAGTARTSASTGPHAWNLVQSGGNWYYLDVTWGDASFRDADDVSEGMSYDYLLTTTADISATHTIGSVVPMPVCDHLEDNYYTREGAYFSEASLEAFAQLTDRRHAEGADCVRFKCASSEIYEQMVASLIDERRIFDYIYKAPGESLLFSRSDTQRTFTVWF